MRYSEWDEKNITERKEVQLKKQLRRKRKHSNKKEKMKTFIRFCYEYICRKMSLFNHQTPDFVHGFKRKRLC